MSSPMHSLVLMKHTLAFKIISGFVEAAVVTQTRHHGIELPVLAKNAFYTSPTR